MNVGCSLVDEMTSASLREAPDGTNYHASPLKLLLTCIKTIFFFLVRYRFACQPGSSGNRPGTRCRWWRGTKLVPTNRTSGSNRCLRRVRCSGEFCLGFFLSFRLLDQELFHALALQRMAADEDRERWAGVLLGAQVRPDAGTHPVPDARGHRGQPGQPRRNRTDPQTIPKGFVATHRWGSLHVTSDS